MSIALLDASIDDRITGDVDRNVIENAVFPDSVTVINLGAPVIDDVQMCAQCVGECKIH